MTQKQTDYDKALLDAFNGYVHKDNRVKQVNEVSPMYIDAFFRGYEHAKAEQTDHERNLNPSIPVGLDHFRDSTKMIRYEIAKAAMQGLMANTKVYDGAKNSPRYAEHTIPEVIAMESIALADALIKELEKEEG